jgi:isoleucyl-tRNA synthetase
VRSALLDLNTVEAARKLLDGRSIMVQVEGDDIEVLPDEVEVRLTAREGFAVSEEGGLIAALVTELTPELVREGLAREVVRRIQDLRKSRGLDIADRVHLTYFASADLARAIEEQREYIMGETLAISLHVVEKGSGEEYELESEKLVLNLEKV